MKKIRILPVLSMLFVGMVAIWACSEQYNGTTGPYYRFSAQSPDSSLNYIPLLAPPSLSVYTSNTTDSARIYYEPFFIECGQVQTEIQEFVESSTASWETDDSNLRLELARWTNHPFYYFIAQHAANRMLWVKLLADSTIGYDRQEAVEYYVNLALQYHHPDAEIFARALPYLEENSFWSHSDVQAAATLASGFASTYLSSSDPDICNCEEDSTSSSGYIVQAIDAKEIKHVRIQAAVAVLDSIASN